jgi:acyl-homoserine-lactone acylase
MKKLLLLVLLPFSVFAQKFSAQEISSWKQQAKRVSIIRDNWGIPHVYGKSDADAVFGLLYAQCEDDFKRVELNYIEKLGRLAEVNGEKDIFNDLQIRLLIDSADAVTDYQNAEPWFKKLLDGYAAGINFYLQTHPNIRPALLTRFKPWYPLLWTDGSIGAINTGNLTIKELSKFYSGDFTPTMEKPILKDQQSGSNGFAFGPSKTENGHAILYINPHTTFYFRPEVQMQSEEGLNVYGAVTWGQFFVYQGFNDFCGWMHTSNNVDIADMYEEKISRNATGLVYEYDNKLLPVGQKNIIIHYKEGGSLKSKTFLTYFTNKGPVMAIRDGKWISLRSKNRNAASLVQSWQRTKSKSFEDYKKAMDLKANGSNNTVYADAKGNIAYWHGNFIPIRDPKYNWAAVVDGSTSATAWKGLHEVNESVHLYNPANGWLQNCNSTPFTVAGKNSPNKEDYPSYMAPDGENFRGINAVRLLNRDEKYNLDKVIKTGYDSYLPAFEILIPALIKAYEGLPESSSLIQQLKEPMAILKAWDYRSAEGSVASTLAFEWAERLNRSLQKVYIDPGEKDQVQSTKDIAAKASQLEMLDPFVTTLIDLKQRYGAWNKPWGEINRFQRLTGKIMEQYADSAASIPVGYGSALWGQLSSFRSARFDTNMRYGYSGNSFVCAVEFGERIKAKSILAGGNSGDPKSKHFNDQAEMYVKGEFKDILFYKEDVLKHLERNYHPGE